MGPSDAVNILIIIILLILSAYFSSAETALTTVNKIRMRSLAEENNKAAKRVLKLIEEPSKMLSAVLICIFLLLRYQHPMHFQYANGLVWKTALVFLPVSQPVF